MPTPLTALPATGDVRQRLLVAALERFNAQGYAATAVREIVAAAGVSKPALYYHFGSKEGLYLALLQGAFEHFEQLLREFVIVPGTARVRLLHYCRSIVDSAVANVEIVRLSHAIYFGPPQGAPPFDFEAFFEKMLAGIEALLAAGMESGEFRALPRHELSWAVMGILNTCLQEQTCRSHPRFDAAGMEGALAILLDGITAGDAQ